LNPLLSSSFQAPSSCLSYFLITDGRASLAPVLAARLLILVVSSPLVVFLISKTTLMSTWMYVRCVLVCGWAPNWQDLCWQRKEGLACGAMFCFGFRQASWVLGSWGLELGVLAQHLCHYVCLFVCLFASLKKIPMGKKTKWTPFPYPLAKGSTTQTKKQIKLNYVSKWTKFPSTYISKWCVPLS
jgi:hypothetical protein